MNHMNAAWTSDLFLEEGWLAIPHDWKVSQAGDFPVILPAGLLLQN
jgi:hypothetical protein